MSLLSIFGFPPTFFEKGVLVTSVELNSTALEQGFKQGQQIIAVEGTQIKNLEEFSKALEGKFTGENTKIIFTTKDTEIIYFSDQVPAITVSEVPKTNIKLGLDLAGGSRALIQAEE